MAQRRARPKKPTENTHVGAPPFPAAWDLRPPRVPSLTEDAWRAQCRDADYLGHELEDIEKATQRELEEVGYPTTIDCLERVFFPKQPTPREAPTERRDRRKWERGLHAFKALLNLRDVRAHVAKGRLHRAVVDALYAGVGGGLLDAAEIGERARRQLRERRPEREGLSVMRDERIRTDAQRLRQEEPTVSERALARDVARALTLPEPTVRRVLRKQRATGSRSAG
jgi:hypothetical protein